MNNTEDTIGTLIGRAIVTITPVANLWAASFDVAPACLAHSSVGLGMSSISLWYQKSGRRPRMAEQQPEALRLAEMTPSLRGGDWGDRAATELRRLHAEADRLRAATGWNPITAPGQVGAGDLVTFTIGDDRHVRRVRRVLSSGQAREELIYDIKRNHYLITSMSMRNEGSQKNVMFHKRPPLPTLSDPAVEGV